MILNKRVFSIVYPILWRTLQVTKVAHGKNCVTNTYLQ
jgi:hypothetical protein